MARFSGLFSKRRHALSSILGRGVIFLVALGGQAVHGQTPVAVPPPGEQFATLNKKIHGSATCMTANCHDAPQASPADKRPGNEYKTWAEKDPHRWTFDALGEPLDAKFKDRYAAIGKNLKIDDPKKSESCLKCHAVNVPAALQGDKFELAEGATCAACHGPADSWFKPHQEVGWFDKQRQAAAYDSVDASKSTQRAGAAPHTKLLKDLGFYDTRPLAARAEKCTSCHLAIDPKLVEAGHPQPIFELAFFSRFGNFEAQYGADVKLANHWRDKPGIFSAQLWSAGQVVSLRDAMLQLAARSESGASGKSITEAYQQAMSHLLAMGQFLKTASIEPAQAAALSAAGAKLAPFKAGKADAGAAAAAKEIATIAGALIDPMIKFAPTADSAKALLLAFAKDATMVEASGHHGAAQQAMAIASMQRAAGGDEAQAKLIADKLLGVLRIHPEEFKAAEFAKAVGEVRAGLGG